MRVESTTNAVSVVTSRTPMPNTVAPGSSGGGECQVGERRAHPTNCNMYFECVFGKLEERRCFAGLHWNGKVGLDDVSAFLLGHSQALSKDKIACTS